MIRPTILGAALLALASLASAQDPANKNAPSNDGADKAAKPGSPANANRSIWTLDVTGFRKQHAVDGGYTAQ